MNRNILMLSGAVIIIIGLVLVFSQPGLKRKFAQNGQGVEAVSKTHSAAGHQAGGGSQQAGPQEAPKPDEAVEEEAPTVEITSEKQQLIGVKIADVSARPIEKVIRTVGRIEYDERKLATVNTKLEGWIEKLYVDYTGRYVKKGEPLAEIYSPELIATQQEFLNTLKWTKQSAEVKSETIGKMLARDSERVLEAARQRLRLWDITDEQVRMIEETGSPIRTFKVFSPVNGYVVQKTALQGMKVMPGEKLFDVADLSTVWIVSDIYEYELSFIRLGQKANIRLSYLPGREFVSTIDYIYPSLAGDTRTAKVRFVIPNPNNQLKPQMFTSVEVKISLGKKLSIPDDAVIDTGTRQIVYVDKGDGYFEPREVLLGARGEGYREVLKGLKAGEKVASSATFLVDSEAQLRGVTPLSGHKH